MSVLDTLIFVFASSTSKIPSSVIVPVVVTLPSSSIEKVVSVAMVYPSGATVSLNVYSVPVFKPSISCASVVESHSSMTFPSASMIWMCAPSTSSPLAMSVLDTLTNVSASSTSSVSSFLLPLYVTEPSLLISNDVSVAIVYPSGATVSFSVYSVPVFKPSII